MAVACNTTARLPGAGTKGTRATATALPSAPTVTSSHTSVWSLLINLARDHNRRGLVSFRHRPPAAPDAPSAEEYATETEGRQEVVEALRALPKRQRDCVALRYYLDLSIPDIAETLGVSTNSVKTHLQRGLRSMAQTLETKQ